MVDRVAIEKIAIACRRGLHTLEGARGSMFAVFPRGACGPASEILGRLLNEQLRYDGQYVCGSEHPKLPDEYSHAWFEVADLSIDITYDQFPETGLSGWIFTRGTGWHAQFACLEKRDGFCMPSGWPNYPHDGYRAALNALGST
jgi:hypothetical protein